MRYFTPVFIFLLFIPLTSWACSCVPPQSNKDGQESYQNANIIVKAVVESTSVGWGGFTPMIKLNIQSVLKGDNVPDLITANYNTNTAACGVDLKAGETYVLGLYDTRSATLRANNARGYGFRVMNSCAQNDIQYYLKKNNLIEKSKNLKEDIE